MPLFQYNLKTGKRFPCDENNRFSVATDLCMVIMDQAFTPTWTFDAIFCETSHSAQVQWINVTCSNQRPPKTLIISWKKLRCSNSFTGFWIASIWFTTSGTISRLLCTDRWKCSQNIDNTCTGISWGSWMQWTFNAWWDKEEKTMGKRKASKCSQNSSVKN